VLRATLDTERLTQRLRSFIGDGQEDIFLINRSGIVQTPSARHGGVLEKAAVEVPEYSERTRSFDAVDPTGEAAVFGYAYIPVKAKPNPFVLFFVKPKTLVEKELARVRLNRMLFLAGSGLTIVFTVVLISIFTFNHLYDADRSKAETMLRMEKAGRLASLGTLSAGIAHEINNPLAAIGQEAGYIKDLLSIDGSRPTDEELLEQIDSILESVFRCGRITRQLLRFAHQGNVDVQAVAIADAVSEVLAFFGKEAEYRNIEIQSSVSDEVPEIMTDRGRLQQILLNLVKNAVQAMVDGGTLLITARRHRREIVRIEVSDTGCGIPEEKLARIFEPFFTTKNQGEGTGLGLSLTYAMVRKLGGNIHVQSEVGKGSRFTVTLPIGVPRGVHENESSAR
jgi:signal transduction histidine kinase